MADETGIALITGASSGIGFALAKCFAEDGHSLVITSENASRLQEAAGALATCGAEHVEQVVADLSKPGSAEELYHQVRALAGIPDFLVNNAGVGVHGIFADETDLASELAMIQLNVVSLVQLTKLFGRDMAERGEGRILITSSLAALAPSPKLTVYSATKAFDYAFAEALANEMKDRGVSVTALLPAETETDFFRRADMEDTKVGRSEKADPDEVARAGYAAMMKGTDHVIAPFSAKLRAALTYVLPESLVTAQARAD